jgi:hypothetical protein
MQMNINYDDSSALSLIYMCTIKISNGCKNKLLAFFFDVFIVRNSHDILSYLSADFKITHDLNLL